MSTGYSAPRATEFYDTFSSFPSAGKINTFYTARDSGIVYLYNSELSSYTVINDPSIVNPDVPEEGTSYYARLATTGPLKACTYNNGVAGVGATLTGDALGVIGQLSSVSSIDTKTVVVGDVILVKNQVSELQNGIYQATTSAGGTNFVLTRIDGFDETSEIYPSTTFIDDGTANKGKYFTQDTVDPVVGTDSISFTISSASTLVSPIIFIDTVATSALPACTYVNGTVYPSTLPAYGATLTANANGALGAINGVTIVSGMKILVNAQASALQKGDYLVTNPGSATSKWKVERISYNSSQLLYKNREWVVSNVNSTLFGNRYSLSSPLAILNTNIGITSLVFTNNNSSSNIYTADGSLSGNRTVTNAGFVLKFNGTVKTVSPGASAGDDAFVIRAFGDAADLFRVNGAGNARVEGTFTSIGTMYVGVIRDLFFTTAGFDIGSNIVYNSRGEIGSAYVSHDFKTENLLTTPDSFVAKFRNFNTLHFSIDMNGVIANPTGPIGNAGRVSGDIYYDTAANALANGDLIAIRKT